MQKHDFDIMSYRGLIVIGGLLLTLGVITYNYFEMSSILSHPYITYPYQQYSGALLIVGAISLFIGLALRWRLKQ